MWIHCTPITLNKCHWCNQVKFEYYLVVWQALLPNMLYYALRMDLLIHTRNTLNMFMLIYIWNDMNKITAFFFMSLSIYLIYLLQNITTTETYRTTVVILWRLVVYGKPCYISTLWFVTLLESTHCNWRWHFTPYYDKSNKQIRQIGIPAEQVLLIDGKWRHLGKVYVNCTLRHFSVMFYRFNNFN